MIYQQRNELLETTDITETITAMREGVLHDLFRIYVPVDSVEEQWDIPVSNSPSRPSSSLLPVGEWIKAEPSIGDDDILQRVLEAGARAYADKVAMVDTGGLAWLRAQRDAAEPRHPLARAPVGPRPPAPGHPPARLRPEEPQAGIQARGLLNSSRTSWRRPHRGHQAADDRAGPLEAQLEEAEAPPELENVQYHHADYDEALAAANLDRDAAQPDQRLAPKVGATTPCPCGSGKKYKHCHGKLS